MKWANSRHFIASIRMLVLLFAPCVLWTSFIGAAVAQAAPPASQDDQGIKADDAVPQQIQPGIEQNEGLAPEIRQVLSRYGTFTMDTVHGEVWTPSVAPVGWHPYPPCHWVKAQRWGLYYDDQTEWGRIVHHFGRWLHDADKGWLWIPGNQFSPAWVVWRSSRAWTGWAPLPPRDDQTRVADTMAGADSWLFQESSLVLSGCKADQIAAPPQISALLVETPYVTRIGFWTDMAVFIVPPWIKGPFVKVDLSFQKWQPDFIVAVTNEWNFVWHHTTISTVKNVCLRRGLKRI